MLAHATVLGKNTSYATQPAIQAAMHMLCALLRVELPYGPPEAAAWHTAAAAADAAGKKMTVMVRHYTRDLPYDYTALVENLLDPDHVPWSHHGVIGNRYGWHGSHCNAGSCNVDDMQVPLAGLCHRPTILFCRCGVTFLRQCF